MNPAQYICSIKDWPMQVCFYDGDANGIYEPQNPSDYATLGFGYQLIRGNDVNALITSQFNIPPSSNGSYQMATLALFSRQNSNLLKLSPALRAALQAVTIQQPLQSPTITANPINPFGWIEEIDHHRKINFDSNSPSIPETAHHSSIIAFPEFWSAHNLGDDATTKSAEIGALSAVFMNPAYSEGIRIEAVDILEKVGGVEQLPMFYGALNNPNFSDKIAFSALLSVRSIGGDSIYPELLRIYNTSTITPTMRKFIVEMAGMSYDPVALQIMSAAILHDPDYKVRGFAVNYIQDSGNCSTIPTLRKVAENDPVPTIRKFAEDVIDIISNDKHCD